MKKRSWPYTAMLSLTGIMLTLLVFLIFSRMINRQIESSTSARIEQYADRQKRYISTLLDSRFVLLRAFSQSFGEQALVDPDAFDMVSRLLLDAGDFEHVLIIDADGYYTVDNGTSGQGENQAGLAALLEGEGSISPPFYAEFEEELSVLLSVPIRNKAGQALGTLGVTYRAQEFGLMLLQDGDREESISMLTDSQGNVLFGASEEELFIPESQNQTRVIPSPSFFGEEMAQQVRESVAAREVNAYTVTYQGEKFIVVQTPFEQNGWMLFCLVPVKRMVAEFDNIMRLFNVQTCAIVAILCACALVMILLLRRDRRRLSLENSALTLRAATDSMTGLLNQASTRAAVEAALQMEGKTQGLLILLDLDDLKGINDTYGHPIGDRAIMVLASRMRAVFTQAEVIGRIGGDEFMIFLRDARERAQVQALIDTFQQQLRLTMPGLSVDIALHCSMGAAFAEPEDDYASLYRRADVALYYVKRHGRNGYAFYESLPEEDR